jgi:hypothetical protein
LVEAERIGLADKVVAADPRDETVDAEVERLRGIPYRWTEWA